MGQELKLSNLPGMTIGQMVDELSAAYSTLINNKRPVNLMPSVMLWGPPGVGKSQGVREIAHEIERKTGKKVNVTDVRLLLFNPIDLRGIPTSNEDKTLAVWLKPKIFQMDESENVINILFLDEISAAPQSVQAAAYQITLDRTVGEHKLPDNCIVIAAGNRVTDKSVAFKMPKALANRLLHLEVDISFDSWKEWAENKGINAKVIGYLTEKRNALMSFNASSEELAFATPRSWEMVSNLLNNIDDDVNTVFQMISGLVGIGAASEFRTWCDVYGSLPDVNDIFSGKADTSAVKKFSPSELYSVISSMTIYARNHTDDINGITNSLKYAQSFPPDFSVLMMKNYMSISEEFKSNLMNIPLFMKWAETKGRLLNGII